MVRILKAKRPRYWYLKKKISAQKIQDSQLRNCYNQEERSVKWQDKSKIYIVDRL